MAYDAEIRVKTDVDTSQMQKIEIAVAKATKKVADAESKLKNLKSQTTVSEPFQDYLDGLEELGKSAEAAREKLTHVLASGGDKEAVLAEIQAIEQEIARTHECMDELERSGQDVQFLDPKAVADAEYQLQIAQAQLQQAQLMKEELASKQAAAAERASQAEAQAAQQAAEEEIAAAEKAAAAAEAAAERTRRAVISKFAVMAAIIKKAFGQIGPLINQAKTAVGNGLKSMVSHFRSLHTSSARASGGLSGLVQKLLSFSMISRALRGVLDLVKSGFENLKQYSSETKNAFDGFNNSTTQLGNSLAAMLAPALNALLPIISSVINAISTAIRYIQMFFAMLGGKTTITVAKATSTQSGYNKALGGTAKAAKKARGELAAFDEIDVLNKNEDEDSGGGGGGAGGIDPADMFEEIPVEALGIKDLLKKLKDFLAGIDWESIKEKARHLGESIAKILNEVFADLELARLLGHTIAEALNTALEFAYGFISTFDFRQFGVFMGTMLNQALYDFDWNLLALTLAQGFNGAVHALYAFLDTIDFTFLGEKLGRLLTDSLIKIDWMGLAQLVLMGFQSITDTLNGFSETIDWELIAHQINTGMRTLARGFLLDKDGTLHDVWAENGAAVGQAIEQMIEGLHEFIATFPFAEFGASLARWFQNAVGEISFTEIFQTIAEGFGGLLDFLIAFMAGINWYELGQNIADGIANVDWATLMQKVGTAIGNAIGSLGSLVYGGIESLIQTIKGYFTDIYANVDWSADAQTIGYQIIGGIMAGIVEMLLDIGAWLYENLFLPIYNGICEAFQINSPSLVMYEIGAFLIEGLLLALQETWVNITTFFQTSLDGLKKTMTEKLLKVLEEWKKKWNEIKTFGETKWNEIKESVETVFTEIHDKITEIMTNVSEKWGTAWEEMKDKLKSVVNGIIRFMNKLIEGIENLINRLAEGLNGLSIDLPEFFGGGHLGFAIQQISLARIPELANGAVLRGGNPFLAFLNDQPAGQTNIEAPLSTIEDALENVLDRIGGAGTAPGEFSMEIDGQTLGRVMLPYVIGAMKDAGYKVSTIGAV